MTEASLPDDGAATALGALGSELRNPRIFAGKADDGPLWRDNCLDAQKRKW